MKKQVTFYDPHPGLKGCPVRLPKAVKIAVDWLDGKTMPLNEAVKVLEEAMEGQRDPKVWTHENDGIFSVGVSAVLDIEHDGELIRDTQNQWKAVNFRYAPL